MSTLRHVTILDEPDCARRCTTCGESPVFAVDGMDKAYCLVCADAAEERVLLHLEALVATHEPLPKEP